MEKRSLKTTNNLECRNTAASFGLEYRDPKFWYVEANVNYLANNYIDVAPITRTSRFFDNTLFSTPGVPVPDVDPSRLLLNY